MPGKSSKEKFLEGADRPANNGYEQFAFLNVELTKPQAEALKKMPAWSEEMSGYLDTVVKAGFQISLKVDGFNNCFAAYMQIRLHSHPCYGFILTGRGSTQIKALRQLLYKHFAVLGEDWSKAKGPQPSAIDD